MFGTGKSGKRVGLVGRIGRNIGKDNEQKKGANFVTYSLRASNLVQRRTVSRRDKLELQLQMGDFCHVVWRSFGLAMQFGFAANWQPKDCTTFATGTRTASCEQRTSE